jgi:hypothetical protein
MIYMSNRHATRKNASQTTISSKEGHKRMNDFFEKTFGWTKAGADWYRQLFVADWNNGLDVAFLARHFNANNKRKVYNIVNYLRKRGYNVRRRQRERRLA